MFQSGLLSLGEPGVHRWTESPQPADANMMEDLETSPSSSHMYPRLEVSYNSA